MADPEYVLGVDIGTASSKGVLCTTSGAIVRRAQHAHRTSLPRPGWAEHDAESVWWADVVAVLRELLPPRPEQVRAVCVSGIGPCVLPAAGDGRPLRPAILYGVDTRAVPLAEEIQRELGGPEVVLERCGSVLSAQSAGPKLAWLRRHEPQVWQDTRMFLMAHTYVAHRLTGAYVLDHLSASQCAPLYDLRARRWIPEWAQRVAPGLRLPELRWPADVAGHVTEAAAAETGLAPGTAVAVGTLDAWAEAESVDVRRPGDLMAMYGSTMFFIGVTGSAVRSPALWSAAGNHPGQHTLAAGMASSGSITDWFRDLSGGAPFTALVAEAAEAPPGANGLLALPYFAGERTPVADPDARGVLAGLTLRHTRGDVYRALLESTALAVRHNLAAFREAGFEVARIVAVGGGTTSTLWPQIVSDVADVAQELPEERSGASYGDAKFAAVAVGAAQVDAEWNRTAATVTPAAALREVYDERYRLYHRLREATLPIQHALARG
jgi:xylulokinase